MDQLISLRHRGAFSTVAQTFTLCCERVRLAKDQAVGELIKKWYKVSRDCFLYRLPYAYRNRLLWLK